MKIFYWSPHISHVATVKAVINSIKSVDKYSYGKITCVLLDAVGEWQAYNKELLRNKIKTQKLYLNEKYTSLPRFGFIRSRAAYWIIFFSSIFSLKKIINLHKPDFLIIHLITSLPILLNYFFNLETKLILRVSGFPKLNLLRLIIWKFFGKKIHKIFCPTIATKNYLIEKKVFDKNKIFVLKDPIISPSEKKQKENEKLKFDKILKNNTKYLLSVGRVTKQKNYFFLVDCFADLVKKYSEYNLIIIGDGEDKIKLQNYIYLKKLEKKIHLFNFKKNIFNYMKHAECFILTSLWEDPGWVLIEAASVNTVIISSNCPNGPVEFLSNGKGGYLFDSNNKESFLQTFDKYKKENLTFKREKVLIAKKKVKEYSLFNHYINLIKILKK